MARTFTFENEKCPFKPWECLSNRKIEQIFVEVENFDRKKTLSRPNMLFHDFAFFCEKKIIKAKCWRHLHSRTFAKKQIFISLKETFWYEKKVLTLR